MGYDRLMQGLQLEIVQSMMVSWLWFLPTSIELSVGLWHGVAEVGKYVILHQVLCITQ